MEITPRELRDVEIRESLRGYNRDEVNDLLERAATTIEAANERVKQLTDRLSTAQSEAGRTRETEEVLHRTLLLAQRAADEAVAEATAKSRQMLDDADLQSRRLLADAEAEARRKGEAERRRHEEEILDLASRRDALLSDVEAMTRFEAEYRERMVRALEADLHALRSRPSTAPGSRPEPSDVEVPESVKPPAPQMSVGARADDAAKVVPAPAMTPPGAASPSVSPPSAPSASSPGAVAPAAAPASNVTDANSTREVDVRTLFEQSQAKDAGANAAEAAPKAAAPAPAPAPAPNPPNANNASTPPIDLAKSEAVDADVLDDDAFFATLRDAVHDDAPLGPREEEDAADENRFYDQDAERGSFRDVFRRRR